MRTKFNKLIDSEAAALFLFGYGLIVQSAAFAVIYFMISYIPVKAAVAEAFVFLWYCIPVAAVFAIVLTVVQIKKRIARRERYTKPLIGLILNSAWFLCYLAVLFFAFISDTDYLGGIWLKVI